MIFYPQLKFEQHIAYMTKKLSKANGIMAKLHHDLPKNVLIDVYYTLFHSHLLYGILTWGSTYSTLIKKLQTLQNRAIRIIESKEWITKVNDVY